jgi:hypothetical protein
MTDIFTSAKSVLRRAKYHITNLESEINVSMPDKPYAYGVNVESDGITHTHKAIFSEDFSYDIGCVMFDAINNLRACLDQMTYAIAVRHEGEDVSYALFPFAKSAEFWPNKINGVNYIPDKIRALFNAFEPYKGGNNTLWAVNYMANIKKHAVLIRAGFGRTVVWESRAGTDAILHAASSDQNEVILGTSRGPDFEAKREFTYSIVVRDAEEIINGQAPIPLLNALSSEVERVLMATEAECRRIGLIA